ncbi:hypothetical protein J3A83DRAFT_4512782 [Scleroderma citrinum]
MHSCLQIDEVLREIFGWVDDGHTLYALSRTCRTFTGPATDLIWETLPNLLPIFRQLSCVESQECGRNTKVTFVDSPNSANRETFRRLASRVHNLHFGLGKQSGCCYPSDSKQMVAFLLDSPRPAHLFPSLLYLSIFDNPSIHFFGKLSKEHEDALMRWLMDLVEVGPTVLNLHCDLVPVIVPALPPIKSICKLVISGDPLVYRHEELTSVLCSTLPKLGSLQSFSCVLDSWDILWHLGHLPALRQLSFRLPDRPTLDNSHNNGGVIFSQLQALDMCGGTLRSIAELFRCANFESLVSLSASPIYIPGDAIGDSQVVDLILDHCCQLRSVRLSHGFFFYTDVHKLDPYSNLRVLTVEMYRSFFSTPWTDDALVPITHGLPHLERFYLLDKPSSAELVMDETVLKPRTEFTLGALVNLVNNCPNLERLSLPFNAARRNQLEYMSSRKNGRVIQSDSVRYLDVCQSQAMSSKRLAKILSGLLPRLEVIVVDPQSTCHRGRP